MSEVVDSLPPRGFRPKYEWSRWTDGRIHRLKRGEDFHTSAKVFVHAAHTHAERHGLVLTARSQGDNVWLVFRAYESRGRS
jgi:hypothetical protein